jgi:hypothetical protein
MNAVEQGDAVAILHDDVGQDEIECIAFEDLESLAAAAGELNVVALPLEG